MHNFVYILVGGLLITSLVSNAKHNADIKPEIQLASIYQDNIDVKQYLVSEKLDGVRGYWDGKFLYSKNGYVINAPKWFTKDFGHDPLDGELWLSRGKFEQTMSIVSKFNSNDHEWLNIRFMVFDLPNNTDVFTARVNKIRLIVEQSKSDYLQMIPQYEIDNNQQLKDLLDKVVTNGGEGLMLHKKQGYYQIGRSKNIVKLKVYNDDEATVLAHYEGKGKFLGKLGSMLVKNKAGIVFKIGTGFSDLERQNPPKVGSKITYKYIGLTNNGKPRFASFVRIYKKL